MFTRVVGRTESGTAIVANDVNAEILAIHKIAARYCGSIVHLGNPFTIEVPVRGDGDHKPVIFKEEELSAMIEEMQAV